MYCVLEKFHCVINTLNASSAIQIQRYPDCSGFRMGSTLFALVDFRSVITNAGLAETSQKKSQKSGGVSSYIP